MSKNRVQINYQNNESVEDVVFNPFSGLKLKTDSNSSSVVSKIWFMKAPYRSANESVYGNFKLGQT